MLTGKIKIIFLEILSERLRQDEKWGEQNWPILDQLLLDRTGLRMCEEYEIPSETRAKFLVDELHRRGNLTYMHILIEEIAEIATSRRNTKAMREEMIQAAAVLVAMIESLDRNGR